jgi:hypothetical protein
MADEKKDPFDEPQSYIAVPSPVQPAEVQNPSSSDLNPE